MKRLLAAGAAFGLLLTGLSPATAGAGGPTLPVKIPTLGGISYADGNGGKAGPSVKWKYGVPGLVSPNSGFTATGSTTASGFKVKPTGGMNGQATVLSVIATGDGSLGTAVPFNYLVQPSAGSTLGWTTDYKGVKRVTLFGPSGKPVGRLQLPWAKTKSGKAVATSYSLSRYTSQYGHPEIVNGWVLTQQVNLASVASNDWPLAVDPTFTWGDISGAVYFNKLETGFAVAAAAGATLCSLLSEVPPAAAACVVLIPSIAAVAGAALSAGQCLEIQYGFQNAIKAYSGDYCS